MSVATPSYVQTYGNNLRTVRVQHRQAELPDCWQIPAEQPHTDTQRIEPSHLIRLSSPCGGLPWGLVW